MVRRALASSPRECEKATCFLHQAAPLLKKQLAFSIKQLRLDASALLTMAALAQREFGQTKYWRTCNRPRSEGRVKGFAANSHHPVAILDRPPGGPTEGPTSEKSSMCKLGRASGGTEPHGSKKAEWDGCRHALRPCCRNLCTRQEALNQLQHRVERPR